MYMLSYVIKYIINSKRTCLFETSGVAGQAEVLPGPSAGQFPSGSLWRQAGGQLGAGGRGPGGAAQGGGGHPPGAAKEQP